MVYFLLVPKYVMLCICFRRWNFTMFQVPCNSRKSMLLQYVAACSREWREEWGWRLSVKEMIRMLWLPWLLVHWSTRTRVERMDSSNFSSFGFCFCFCRRGYRGEELLALIGLCLVRSTMRKPQDNPTRLLSSLYCLFILHCRSEARTVPLIISSHRFFAFMLGCLQILHIKQASRLLLRSCKTYPVIWSSRIHMIQAVIMIHLINQSLCPCVLFPSLQTFFVKIFLSEMR